MYKKQQGLTMVSWIVVVSFLGVLMIAALNIIPSYLNYMSAQSILDDLGESSELKGKSPKDVKVAINKHFKMNNLRNIKVKDAITIKKRGSSSRSGFTVQLKYEDRGKIMGNLFFVTQFNHTVEIKP